MQHYRPKQLIRSFKFDSYHHLVEKRSYYVDASYIKATALTWTPYTADVGGTATSFARLKINGARAADEGLMIGFTQDETVTVSLDSANNVTHVYCSMTSNSL